MPQRSERDILADVKRLAVEYHELTGKPLGVTGEVAEAEAADKLELELAGPRTKGFDAVRRGVVPQKVQIKGRRVLDRRRPYRGRVPRIDLKGTFDSVALVLLDERYDAFEIWEASRSQVEARLMAPGSKARNERGSLGISQFRSIAKLVWERQG